MPGRTFAIGDIHGDLQALGRLLGRLPAPRPEDTILFIGDYVDRGPDSRGVIERVRRLQREAPCRVVALRGNHEDKWLECWDDPQPGFLLSRGNGCVEMYRDFVGKPPLGPGAEVPQEDIVALVQVQTWLPEDVIAWMRALPLWHEDEHAIYVHAGLDGEGEVWHHPANGRGRQLVWMREPDFFRGYRGKRLVFGHTVVTDLPRDHMGRLARLFDDPKDVWLRGDLVGIDTGCGKGGFLSAIELPRMKVYESR